MSARARMIRYAALPLAAAGLAAALSMTVGASSAQAAPSGTNVVPVIVMGDYLTAGTTVVPVIVMGEE